MNDEMSPEVTEALRSALGHLESQAPSAPQLPTGPLLPARRFWPKPAIAVAAFALAALVALPGLWWLRSDDDAIGPDSSSTSAVDPTSTSEPGTTAPTSTVVTLPPIATGIGFQRVPDLTGVFASGTLVETAPSQNGDTVMGTSGIAVVAVADSPEGLVAVGYEHIGLRSVAAAWISDDGGLTWERIPHDPAVFGATDHPIGAAIHSGLSMDAVVYGQGRFVALGTDTTVSTGPVAWFSDDGRTWTRVPAPDGPQPGDGYTTVSGLVAVSNGFVAVGVNTPISGDPMAYSTVVWTSLDGTTWQTVLDGFDPATSRVVTDLTVVDGSLVAVGYSLDPAPAGAYETAAAWVSHDGFAWAPAEVIDETGDDSPYTNMHRVIASPTGGIAWGYATSFSGTPPFRIAVWTSADGVTWTRVSIPDLNRDRFGVPGTIVAGPGGFVGIVNVVSLESAGGESSPVVWTSEDGLTWEETETGFLGTINDLAVLSGRYVAVGEAPGEIEVPGEPGHFFSDGAVWIAEAPLPESVTEEVDCQVQGEGLVLEDQPGLPEAVAARRQAIFEAALACDYEQLAALAALDEPLSLWGFVGSRGGSEQSWQSHESGDYGVPPPIWFLVRTLNLPYADASGYGPEDDDGRWYVWPAAADDATAWSAVSSDQRDQLAGLYSDEELARFEEWDEFSGYRIVIREDGLWWYFGVVVM